MKEKQKGKQEFTMYVDSEWGSDEKYLSYQVYVPHLSTLYLYHSENYPLLNEYCKEKKHVTFPVSLNQTEDIPLVTVPWDFEAEKYDFTSLLSDFLNRIGLNGNGNGNVSINIEFFYSLRDLYPLVNHQFFLSKFQKTFPKKAYGSYITQKRCVFGRFKHEGITFKLRDYYGLSAEGFGGLLNKAGINNPFKGELDDYKSCMEKTLLDPNLIEKFVSYSLADVFYLSLVNDGFKNGMNAILEELDFPKKHFFENIPITIGGISNQFLEKFIDQSFEKYEKNGVKTNLLERFKTLNNKIGVSTYFEKKNKENNAKDKVSNLINGSSIKTIAHLHIMDSGLLNSLTAGGRAFNEREDEFLAKKVMDVDFCSCYGSALSKFEYPLGLPSVYANSSQDTPITLKEFLDSYEDELVDDFYTITISGKLNFSQTFLYSKIIDEEKLKKRIMDVFDDDDSDLNIEKNDTVAEMVVLNRELVNTIITSDTLKIIKAICSKTEKNSIYNCRVETALFYKKSERVIDLNEYLSKLEVLLANKKNTFTYNQDTKSIHDNRPCLWTSLPLKNLIDPLISIRKNYQSQEKLAKEQMDFDLSLKFKSKQILVKTIVNSIYGVITSPHYDVCNINLSKNITTLARNHVFLMSKALHGYQSITDGTTFSPYDVFYFEKGKKPGLETMSDHNLLKKHRYVELGSLDIPWKPITKEEILLAESVVKKHVTDFYEYYGLQLPYNLELKPDHIANSMIYIKKADYALKDTTMCKDDWTLKSRGVLKRTEKTETGLYKVVVNIEEGKKIDKLDHEEIHIITIHDYLECINKNNKMRKLNKPLEPVKIPGYSEVVVKNFRYDGTFLSKNCAKHHKDSKRIAEKNDYTKRLLEESFQKVFLNMFENNEKVKGKYVKEMYTKDM